MVNFRTDFTDFIDLYNNLSINAVIPLTTYGLNGNFINNGNSLFTTYFIEDATSMSPRFGHLNNETISIKYLNRLESLIMYYDPITPDENTYKFTLLNIVDHNTHYDATFLIEADDIAAIYLLQDQTDRIIVDSTDIQVTHYSNYSRFFIDNTILLNFIIDGIGTLTKPLLFYSNPKNYSHYNIINIFRTYGGYGLYKNIWGDGIKKFNLTNYVGYSTYYTRDICPGLFYFAGAGQIGNNVIIFSDNDYIFRYNSATMISYRFTNKYWYDNGKNIQGETHNEDKFIFFNQYSLTEIKDTGMSFVATHPSLNTDWETSALTEDTTNILHIVYGASHDTFDYDTKSITAKAAPPMTAVYRRILETQDDSNLLYHDRTSGQSTYWFRNYILIAETWTIKTVVPEWYSAITPANDTFYLSTFVDGDHSEYEFDIDTNTRSLKMFIEGYGGTSLTTYYNGITYESDLIEYRFK